MRRVLDRDQRARAALEQAGRYFMGTADVQLACNRVAAKLGELGIDYAICGGLAVSAHGHRRTTSDIDILVTEDGLRRFKDAALGRGWLERFAGSRGVRDMDNRTLIDFLVAGRRVDDRADPAVLFPDPAACSVAIDGKRYLDLATLVERKLASGLSAPDRLQDFADVIQLVRACALPRAFRGRLHGSVRAKFDELWSHAQRPKGEY